MELGIAGKVAVVTGASRGIGRAICEALAREGAAIAAVATTEAGVEGTVRECRELGCEAEGFAADVAAFDAVQELGKRIVDRFGRVDVLVNNAGVTRDGLFLRMSEEDWDRVLDVNLKGAFNMTRALARPLLKSRGARIVNIASVIGISGNAGQANYAASKGGLIAMTRSLAKELGSRGVTVNAVAPGYIETDMTAALDEKSRAAMVGATALERAGTPADVAGAVVFLASSLGAFVTGQVIVVDGGLRL